MRFSTLCLSACLVAGVGGPALAQAPHPGVHIRVEAPAFLVGRFQGTYLGRSGDTLMFGDEERGPVRVPSSAITRLDISGGRSRGRGAVRGALIGALTMGLATALTINDTTLYDERVDGPKGAYVRESVLAGAVVGGIIGLFVPVRVWRRADPQILLNAARIGGSGAIGVRFALRYSP